MRHRAKVLICGVLLALSNSLWADVLPINSRLGGDFTLQSTAGGEISLSSYRGKVVLLNFGYTHCPDICPTVLNRLGQVMRRLAADEASDVRPLFVSFDPERDSIPHLKSYLTAFYPGLVGMTGTPERIAAAAKQYAAVYFVEPGDSAAGKLFAHSDFIYLLDRQGRVRTLFNNEQTIDVMADNVRQLLKED